MLINLDVKTQNRLSISATELSDFCSRWDIREMALFGSVLREDFHDESDIDVLIVFAPSARQGLLTLARIKHELEALVNHPVDLAVKASIQNSENWIRRQEILSTAQTIYEQR